MLHAGPAASENGSQADIPLPSPRQQDGPAQNGKTAAAESTKANGKHTAAEAAVHKDMNAPSPAPAGSRAQLDAHKALEETVLHLKASSRHILA